MGAAAVLLDGRLVDAELLLAAQAGGHEVTTAESIEAPAGEPHPIQAALLDAGAIQSGYTAAPAPATKTLLEHDPDPDEATIRDALSGILDREGAYVKTVAGVRRAAALLRGEEPAPPEVTVVAFSVVPGTSVVAKSERKVDALRLVKSKPCFTADLEPPGLLHAKVLRSPHAHARILAIDDSAARALPGVHAVVHLFNTPRVKYSSAGQSWPNPYPWDQVSFDDKVRYVGDRVAVVAAETPGLAERACRLIDVKYEVLASRLRPGRGDAARRAGRPRRDRLAGIVRCRTQHRAAHRGQTSATSTERFARAEHVFEQTYRVQHVAQCAPEPHVTIGWLDEDERLVVRTSTQVPFHVRRIVAPLLGLPIGASGSSSRASAAASAASRRC